MAVVTTAAVDAAPRRQRRLDRQNRPFSFQVAFWGSVHSLSERLTTPAEGNETCFCRLIDCDPSGARIRSPLKK